MNTSQISHSVTTCLHKYADFGGRASRPEYWYFYGVTTIALLLLAGIDSILWPWVLLPTGLGPLATCFGAAILLPLFAVGARRLHDTDRPGWLTLVQLVPLVGGLAMFVLALGRGTPGANRFGPAPAPRGSDRAGYAHA